MNTHIYLLISFLPFNQVDYDDLAVCIVVYRENILKPTVTLTFTRQYLIWNLPQLFPHTLTYLNFMFYIDYFQLSCKVTHTLTKHTGYTTHHITNQYGQHRIITVNILIIAFYIKRGSV